MLSLGSLWLGPRMIDRPLLRRLGGISHAKKIRALDSMWPMTLVRPAIGRKDHATVATILVGLVALKSAASFVFGLLVIFWLSVASLVVPAIVAAHDGDTHVPSDWVQAVARLQVTSHAMAAALGFAVTLAGPLAGRSPGSVLNENAGVVLTGAVLSAVAAGLREAAGVATRGI
jgi:hypothetical protein